jgi:hypothetical protein
MKPKLLCYWPATFDLAAFRVRRAVRASKPRDDAAVSNESAQRF